MKTKSTKSNRMTFRYLLFLPFLFFTFCEEDKEIVTISQSSDQVITKDSKIVSMVLEYLSEANRANSKSDDDDNDNDEQCIEFQYPITFFAILPTSQNIETITVNNDQEFFDFFDTLDPQDQIMLDFPIELFTLNGVPVTIMNFDDLLEMFTVAVSECREDDHDDDDHDDEDDELEYCNDKETKVYICHNGHTICVSVNAINAHMAHGDTMGECDD